MKGQEILSAVDHTLLKATATWDDIQRICNESIECGTASVCVPASYIKRIAEEYGDKINICTVIGFPLGYDTTEVKVFAARQAILDGASEVDMVVNLGDVKNGDFNKVLAEISVIKEVIGDNLLKVIVETCYLTENEKKLLCKCVTDSGADYIKTSTGFGSAGATHGDVQLFRQYIGENVKIKAAGGIRTIDDMKKFLDEGCSRIGASAAVELLKNRKDIDF